MVWRIVQLDGVDYPLGYQFVTDPGADDSLVKLLDSVPTALELAGWLRDHHRSLPAAI